MTQDEALKALLRITAEISKTPKDSPGYGALYAKGVQAAKEYRQTLDAALEALAGPELETKPEPKPRPTFWARARKSLKL